VRVYYKVLFLIIAASQKEVVAEVRLVSAASVGKPEHQFLGADVPKARESFL
jgi:hypothetical protein